MKTPTWEVSTGALAALLNGVAATQLRMVDLYTITLAGGTVLRYSGSDEPVILGAILWELGPILRRTRTRTTSKLEVDTCDITFSAPPALTISGTPFITYITAGGFDNARLVLERAFSAGPGQPWQGALHLFSGRMGGPTGGRHEKKIQVRSDVELLNARVPRNVYQPACLNNVYDPDCGVSRATHAVSGAATSAADATGATFSHGVGGVATDHWALGELLFTTGANTGVRRTVASNASGAVTVIEPWPFTIAPGDAFTAWPGCDGTRGTCLGKFSNLARYRGMPFVPVAETVT